MISSGIFDLPWWGYLLVALALTHVTIIAVTLYLHRHQTHRALELHQGVSHFFRLWLWLTTGMVTREAVKRRFVTGRERVAGIQALLLVLAALLSTLAAALILPVAGLRRGPFALRLPVLAH